MELDSKKPPWESMTFFKGASLSLLNSIQYIFPICKYVIHVPDEYEELLQSLREQIDYYDTADIDNWEYYKKIVHPYELVYTQKKYINFPDSLSVYKPLSRSFFKMIEMLHISDIFNTFPTDSICSAHVCEGPGGFIEGIIDECKKKFRKYHQGLAMTLSSQINQTSTDVHIPGWRRASHFLQKNPTVRILHGEDNTGNIMLLENQESFINQYRNGNNNPLPHIFTGDGGFDFSTDYGSQEKNIFPLLVASTRIGFEILRKDGVFVLKFFDTNLQITQDFIFFMSLHFKKWMLYKPAISRPCNPEQYFIGVGFKGCTPQSLQLLRGIAYVFAQKKEDTIDSTYDMKRLFSDIPYDIQYIISQNRMYSIQRQILYLQKVFSLIHNSSEKEIQNILKMHEFISLQWCQTYGIHVYANRVRYILQNTY
jgi:hypothetical protein